MQLKRTDRSGSPFRIALGLGIVLFGSTALAQSATFKGQVLTDSTERPIPGVTVTIELLRLSAISDSLGEFTINAITPGTHLVSARRIGFTPVTTRITFMTGAMVEADLMMVPTAAQTLPDVKVETKAVVHGKLGEYAVTGRMSQPAGAMTTGKLQPCYVAVVLDGIFVYGAGDNEPMFNVNQINPTTIAGIEYYVGPASMPAKWNATRTACGLLAIWTK